MNSFKKLKLTNNFDLVFGQIGILSNVQHKMDSLKAVPVGFIEVVWKPSHKKWKKIVVAPRIDIIDLAPFLVAVNKILSTKFFYVQYLHLLRFYSGLSG